MVAPYSGAIFARVARSANFKLFKPGPKYSTNFSTTPFSRSISTTRKTKSVAVALCCSSPRRRKPITSGMSMLIG